MLSALALSALALTGAAVAQNTATSTADVLAAKATAKTESPTSHVPGRAFDRFVVLWCENTDYSAAMSDPNFAWLASKGITLNNYFGVTHPSEPNYVASISGDNFGMDNDNFNQVAGNVSTIVDLLEDRGISWSTYQEDMPYSGFEGFSWVDAAGKNDYVRKHDPPVIFNANVQTDRLAKIKNFTMFNEDLKNNQLPQWMFITPNMTNDGHDSSVTIAGQFVRNFMEPLLNNTNFMQNTAVLITFDENHTYTVGNRVFSILLGDAIPKNLVGTNDAQFYDHYSEISTVEANWGLNTLGRWDVGANVFQFVADKTGDKNTDWPALTGSNPTRFLNQSFAGPFNSVVSNVSYPVPNSLLIKNGRIVRPEVTLQWGLKELQQRSYYQNTVEIPDGLNPPAGWAN